MEKVSEKMICDFCGREIKDGEYITSFNNEYWGQYNKNDLGIVKKKSLYGTLKYLRKWSCVDCSKLKIGRDGEGCFTDEEIK